jgi:hypothetical protein
MVKNTTFTPSALSFLLKVCLNRTVQKHTRESQCFLLLEQDTLSKVHGRSDVTQVT